MDPILAFDIGTSGVKAIVMDSSCQVIESVFEPVRSHFPAPGFSEQDPDDWWKAVCAAAGRLKQKKFWGIGLSGQMHGMTALDKEGSVIRPAILWNDQRTESECRMLVELAGGSEKLLDLTNDPMLTGFTAGKILWMKLHEPDNYKKTCHIINPKDYIAYKLTGNIATDVSDASGTGLFDVKDRRFSDELIAMAGFERSFFPDVLESSAVTGRVTREAAQLTGITEGTLVTAGGGDAVLSSIAMGITGPDTTGIMLGTSGVCAKHSETFFRNRGGLLQFSRACIPGLYHIMGVTLCAAGSHKWICEKVLGIPYEKAEELARGAGPASKVLFTPYLSGERCPLNDPHIRGSFTGLETVTGPGELIRAVMEGVAFSLREVYELIDADRSSKQVVISGGGARSGLWRQIFADVLSLPVVTLGGAKEGSALGAAIIAGTGLDMFHDASSAAASLIQTSLCLPDSGPAEIYEEKFNKFKQIRRK